MDCLNCRRVAPNLCTYHIMDLSGCDMGKVGWISEEVFKEYRCPHCDRMVSSTKFCDACYGFTYSEYLMKWIAESPRFRCDDCGAPRLVNATTNLNTGPCGRCLRRGLAVMTPLTPEQLAHWVKGVRHD